MTKYGLEKCWSFF